MSANPWAMKTVTTPVGPLWIVTFDHNVWSAEFQPRWDRVVERLARAEGPEVEPGARSGRGSGLTDAGQAIRAYFRGDLGALSAVPLSLEGPDYAQKVWRTVRKIAPGSTSTYAQVAKRAGKPEAFRATGHANGMNPCALLVPCHRVVSSTHRLTGYGGGLAAKAWLLEHEGVPNDGARLLV
ncbi:MAG: methylated-DNA--[protein]-cysteine S-methyltransferase [Deltaproteobacteria bacterium]